MLTREIIIFAVYRYNRSLPGWYLACFSWNRLCSLWWSVPGAGSLNMQVIVTYTSKLQNHVAQNPRTWYEVCKNSGFNMDEYDPLMREKQELKGIKTQKALPWQFCVHVKHCMSYIWDYGCKLTRNCKPNCFMVTTNWKAKTRFHSPIPQNCFGEATWLSGDRKR